MTFINRDNYLSWLLLLAAAIVAAWFCYDNVWLGDDIKYAFSWVPGHEDDPIQSLSDIFVSQNAHYFSTNGRYAAHVLVQLFCGILGHGPFAVANGLFYIFFFIMLGKLCGVRMSDTRGMLAIVLLGLLTFQTKMVPSCQIGYIWTFALTMLFLYVFFGKSGSRNLLLIILAGILSLPIGNGQEALNLGVSGALVIYWAMNMRKMTPMQYTMMIGFGLGTLVCCLSPAAWERAAEATEYSVVSYLVKCGWFFVDVRAFYFLLVVVVWNLLRRRKRIGEMYRAAPFFWNVWIILFLFNAVISSDSNRQLFGMELMSLVLGFRLLGKRALPSWILAVLGAVLLSLYTMQWDFCGRIRKIYTEIDRQYRVSPDGIVYVDLNQATCLPHSTHFDERINYYQQKIRAKAVMHTNESMKRHFHLLYPNHPDIRVVPSFLKGKENERLGNRIVTVQPGVLLVIQDKKHPKSLYLQKDINFCGLVKKYDPIKIAYKDRIICEGKYWQAQIVDKTDYVTYGISTDEFFLK